MGAQTSKVARKLPTKPKIETLQDLPKESPSNLSSIQHAASDTKTDFIEADSGDPHLLDNLKTLGPVAVPPTITKMRPTDTMLNIIKQRKRVEANETKDFGVAEDAISTDSLFSLFEQRKHLAPGAIDQPKVKQNLMETYKLDERSLDILLKYYNTIAVMPVLDGDKEERRPGVWVNDSVDWRQKVEDIQRQNMETRKAKEKALKDNEQQNMDKMTDREKKLQNLFEEE